MKFKTALACSASLLALSVSAMAQTSDYPSRTIRWIVPYLAGTAPDNTVRIVAEAMSGQLKQPVVVDNKPGAAGNLGAQLAARAPADGYTWVYSATPMAASMRMYSKPGFDVMKDFRHVGRIAISDLTVVVHPESGFKTIKDLMDRARQQPGKLTYASGGVGSPAHMGAELMLTIAGVDVLHVPYKGASESTAAVMGKQVDFALAITSVAVPHISSGRLTPLAITGPQRNPRQPNTPTLAESGWSGFQVTSFGGLSVPAGTPQPVVNRIREALSKALEVPEVRAKLEAQGGLVSPSRPEEYQQALEAEIGITERMMKAAKLQAQ
jgi:tripartite-type tricarboxylate transporter receptor subunit TctC